MRHKVQVFGWTLIWSGIFIFGYIGFQLWGTDIIAAGVQEAAEDELVVALEETREELPEVEEVDPTDYLTEDSEIAVGELPEVVENHPEESVDEGEAFGFIRVPKIGVDVVMFEGVTVPTLKNGPGHMPGTPLPGQVGNAVVSGHRTTYGRPFFDFDLLESGDVIQVETAIGTHTYTVRETQIVEPTDIWVTDPRAGGWLTLTTCHPKFSARERLIIFAELTDGPNADFAKLHNERFKDQL